MITNFNSDTIASVTEGVIVGACAEVSHISIDSRTKADEPWCFVAIVRKKNGADFSADAVHNGAKIIIINKDDFYNINKLSKLPVTLILVANTLTALRKLAKKNVSLWRDVSVNNKLIAITGSNGKTTSKEMLAHVLKTHLGAERVLATVDNLNNEYGVPLTLLSLSKQHCYAVIEMGAAKKTDISVNAELANPDIAIITNIGYAHNETFGSFQQTLDTKSELIENLTHKQTAILNYDTDYFDILYKKAKKLKHIDELHSGSNATENHEYTFCVLNVSLYNDKAHAYATDITMYPLCSEFTLNIADNSTSVKIHTPGKHNIYNALQVALCAHVLGINIHSIQTMLADFYSIPGRGKYYHIKDSILIDDTYNANPDSVKTTIDMLAKFQGYKKILVLGDMQALGDKSIDTHKQLGRYAYKQGIDCVYSIGILSKNTTDVFYQHKQQYSDVVNFTDNLQGLELVKKLILNDISIQKCVLSLKSSRTGRLERLLDMIQGTI